MKKSNAGRPSLLTDETQAKIIAALRSGNFRNAAFGFAGVSPRTAREWMATGKDPKSKRCHDFRRAVLEAEKQAEIRAVALVMKAAEKDPKHAEWWLSHRWPGRWADKSRVKAELTGRNGGPIAVSASADEAFAKLRSVLDSARANVSKRD